MFLRLLLFCGLATVATSTLAMTLYKSTDANGVVSYSDRPSKGSQVFVFQDRMVERLDNQGDGGLQVSLQPTDFARLLRWLISLEEQGVRVEEAGLERAEKGLVSTRLLLRAG